jgi:hypothetical protein
VIFEFQSIGQYVKVMAMDTATMTEITIQGPASASEAVLKTNSFSAPKSVSPNTQTPARSAV